MICKSRCNRNLPTIDGLLPSQQTYVFSIFFGEVVPFLLDKTALANTQLVLSNQCPIMVPQLSHSINLRVFGGGKHRLCKWHKVLDLILFGFPFLPCCCIYSHAKFFEQLCPHKFRQANVLEQISSPTRCLLVNKFP